MYKSEIFRWQKTPTFVKYSFLKLRFYQSLGGSGTLKKYNDGLFYPFLNMEHSSDVKTFPSMWNNFSRIPHLYKSGLGGFGSYETKSGFGG